MAIETFSREKNLARVSAGFKGGDSFKNPVTLPPTSFVGWPAEVDAKLAAGKIPQPKPLDVWNVRRANGMK